MDLLSILGWSSFALTIVALHLLGQPSRKTFPIFIISVIVQAYVFWQQAMWGFFAQMIVLLGYNIRNWIRWKREGVG